MRGQEKEEDSPSCVQLLPMGVSLSSSFNQGGQANRAARARSGRSGRSSLPAHMCIAHVQAGGAGRQTLTAYASGQIERVGVNVVDQTESQWRTSTGR